MVGLMAGWFFLGCFAWHDSIKQMISKALTLSIVIPVYNEQNHLKDCLDSIARQTCKPTDVIVVDNNSSDNSVKIAQSYSFVKVLHEKRQGQVFAQATGFNAAKSAILGRIDADSILPVDWVEKVIELFHNEPATVALTGDADPYDTPLKAIAGAVFRFYHSFVSRIASGHVMLWGANMAVRTREWDKVGTKMTFRSDVWEDYELSFHLAKLGRIHHLAGLRVGCSFRAAHKPLKDQWEYQHRAIRTFRLNTSKPRLAIFVFLWHTMILLFPIAMIDHLVELIKSR